MPKTLRFILGDQLTRGLATLRDADKTRDVVLLAEVFAEASNVKHHKQKIVFVFSAMRHFAESLRQEGFTVDYIRLDDAGNTQDLGTELTRALARHHPDRVILTEPSEWRVMEAVKGWRAAAGVPLEIRPDDRFLCSRDAFAAWAKGRKQFRMEFFYRQMRQQTGLLMCGTEPEGGQWNFDHDNRKKLPKTEVLPKPLQFPPDAITQEVMALVAARFGDHFGELDRFNWAVTREGALRALEHFIVHGLPRFGDYQDAMRTGADFVFHSLLSPYLNFGLLTPREVCDAAVTAWSRQHAPLNAVEGFIRQIIGWREYVRGIYWHQMPQYPATNHLNANRNLPWFYWSGETPMQCMRECVRTTRQNAYAHHIQRLMVLGNFALLAGIAPAQIEEWFLVVYADALDWVELPNVHGMVMHADGGLLGSKPYAASGAYINRMSDYCAGCRFDPAQKTGPKACPFNYLYWNFLIENEAKLATNPRMAMPYRNLARFSPDMRQAMQRQSLAFLDAAGDTAGSPVGADTQPTLL